LIFIVLVKFRKRLTEEEVSKTPARYKNAGVKILSAYWTLGRYDAVLTVESPDSKSLMKALLQFGDLAATETLVALPRDEATALL
jgi:uncharacterized protein with GYD domain